MARITGAKAHAARLKRIQGEEMVREVGKALYVAGDMIKVHAQISITSGSVSGAGHVPSQPGQPPNNDTGVLAAHIETALVGPLRVEVTSNARSSDTNGAPFGGGRKASTGQSISLAVALEVGTSKMAARPYMRPAAQKKKAEAVELVRRAVKKVVDQAGRGSPKG